MTGDRERLARAFHPPAEHYDIRDTAAFSLTQAYRGMRAWMAPDRWELGLYETRDLVLLELARLEAGATPTEIRESLGLTWQSLSPMLRRSEAAGYVDRERDPSDRRRWRLRLTDVGARCALQAASMWRGADEALTVELGEANLSWLRRLSQDARAAFLNGISGEAPSWQRGRVWETRAPERGREGNLEGSPEAARQAVAGDTRDRNVGRR
jgi:MarR family transcriptional regulator, organic hydroperoxide resistance regulator